MKIKDFLKHTKTKMHENRVHRDTLKFSAKLNLLQDLVQQFSN